MMEKMMKVAPFGKPGYTKEDMLAMEPDLLRALMRERTHHTIEVPFYSLLANGKKDAIPAFGLQAQMVFDVWKSRNLPLDEPDLLWVQDYLAIAQKVRNGEPVIWNEKPQEPFTEDEMKVVEKLIYGRHSIRDFADKPIPDDLIHKILEAGRAAPVGCNLDEVRFIVLKKPEELNMIWSDIAVRNAVVIVIAYDTRIPKVIGQNITVPQNAGFDGAAAADHMLLMAHALGLGGVWLSKMAKSDFTKDTAQEFKDKYGLPDFIGIACHIAIGWPANQTIKSKRVPLNRMIITRDTFNKKQ